MHTGGRLRGRRMGGGKQTSQPMSQQVWAFTVETRCSRLEETSACSLSLLS